MAYDSRSLDDYVDVAERIAEFRGKYPDGSLRGDWRIERIGEQALVAYRAEAWRTPDDSAPGVGCAWELVPGRTPFTKGSELQNAETSAWGRAIIAVGAADAKRGIASRDEVEVRRAELDVPPEWMRDRMTPTKTTGTDHEQLRGGAVEPTPDDRPADRQKPVDNPPVDMWTDQAPGDFDIGQPEARPGSIDPRGAQMRNLQRAFQAAGITDRTVRLGMVSDMIGREILTANQLSQVEACHVIEALKERTSQQ
jgi:hypothetical protein